MSESLAQQRSEFRTLHESQFILPNPWDIGSARLFASLGFKALATTSAGFAGTLGRPDGTVTRDEALDHAKTLASATELPLSADLENGFGDDPKEVARTIEGALHCGLAGASIEDFAPHGERAGLYDADFARERIVAAVEANRADEAPLVLTARAENHIRGNPDLADTIARLQSFQEAGADVLYAPGLSTHEDIASVCASVDRPLNVLIMPGGPSVTEIFEAGAARVSAGSALSTAAQAATVAAARELLDDGTHQFWAASLAHMGTIQAALRRAD